MSQTPPEFNELEKISRNMGSQQWEPFVMAQHDNRLT